MGKVRRIYLPFINPDREYESPLGQYRVARGLTINELAEKCGIHLSNLVDLQNGMLPPYYLKKNSSKGVNEGDLRPGIETMCKVLGASLGELFPRYICDIERYKVQRSFVPSQLEEFHPSVQFTNPEKSAANLELKKEASKCLATLSPREEAILRMRIYEGETLEEIGEYFDITWVRVRQIEAKALRKLRHPTRSGKLKHFL